MHTHSIVRSIAVLISLACLACAPAAHAQVKLDFENLANLGGTGGGINRGHSITQNGFTVSATSTGTNLFSIPPNPTNGSNYTGSVALFNNSSADITKLTQNNGNPFTINSIDLANYAPNFSSGFLVVYGNKQSGNVTQVVQTFTFTASNNLQTLVFNDSFTNLASVSFGQGTNYPYVQFDNIVLNTPTAVPEPSSVALLVGAVVTGAGFVRRRRGKRCVR